MAACRALLADPTRAALPRATLLVLLGNYLKLCGRGGEATRYYKEAVEDGGPSIVDARVTLAWSLFDTGRAHEGAAVLAELRRSKPDLQTYAYVGELYETYDDLSSALRWWVAGLTRSTRGWRAVARRPNGS